MARKTKQEYLDEIEGTRGNLSPVQSAEYDQPLAPERTRRLNEFQCHILLDILMTLRQMDRKLGDLKTNGNLPMEMESLPAILEELI